MAVCATDTPQLRPAGGTLAVACHLPDLAGLHDLPGPSATAILSLSLSNP